MIRTAFALVLMTVTAQAKTITVGERLGGYLHQHIKVAKRWLATKTCVRASGDQWSAASIQLRYMKHYGGCVCKTRNIYFHDHAGRGWKSYPAPIKRCR